jgi:hypothetical protein
MVESQIDARHLDDPIPQDVSMPFVNADRSLAYRYEGVVDTFV